LTGCSDPSASPLLETLSKIFNGIAVKGASDSRWIPTTSKKDLPFQVLIHPWEPKKKKNRKERDRESGGGEGGNNHHFVVSQKGAFVDVAEVQRESLAALDNISVEDFRQCFQQWEWRWDRCIQSQGENCEGD